MIPWLCTTSRPLARLAATVLPMLALACTFGDASTGGAGDSGSSGGTGAESSPVTTANQAEDGPATTNPSDGDGTAGDTNGDGTDGNADGDSDGTGGPVPVIGCPERMPDDWLFCSDFEGDAPLEATFSVVDNAGGRLALSEDKALSGDQSLRLAYDGLSGYGGFVGLLLGDLDLEGNVLPKLRYGDGADVREIWVHYRVATGDAWPGSAVGRIARVTSMNEAWDPDVQVSLQTEDDSEALVAIAQDCSDARGDNEMVSWNSFEDLDHAASREPIFDEASQGQWHCVELRVDLGTDDDDGEIELWVDGDLMGGADGIEWPGGERGFNYVAISNAWPDGEDAPPVVDGEIFYDDLIVSTAAINGC